MSHFKFALRAANDVNMASSPVSPARGELNTGMAEAESGCIKSGPPAPGKQSVSSKRRQLQDIVESSLIDIGHVRTVPQQEELCHIILDLVPFGDAALRRRLAEKIAPCGWASRELVWLLASDDIEVAQPILLQSPVLTDAQLVDIAKSNGQGHRMAIASREGIGASVCTALNETGASDVTLEMLLNINAQIPASVIHGFCVDGAANAETRTALLMRRDLPASACRILLIGLAQTLTDPASGHCGPAAQRLRPMLLALAAGLKEAVAVDVMRQLVISVSDTPTLALGLMEAGQEKLFLYMLSRVCSLPLKQVELIVATRNVEALAVICRSAGFGPDDFVSLMHLIGQDDGGSDKTAALEDLIERYTTICPERAREALQRWIRTPAD